MEQSSHLSACVIPRLHHCFWHRKALNTLHFPIDVGGVLDNEIGGFALTTELLGAATIPAEEFFKEGCCFPLADRTLAA